MGKVTLEIVKCTCDICGAECNEEDSKIEIKVNNGDERGVGSAYIYSTLRFEQHYGCSNGIVCNICKKKYLAEYVKSLDFQQITC